MKASNRMLALDVGTSSVRAFVGAFDGGALRLGEQSRFYIAPVETPTSVCWDMLGIHQGIEDAISRAARDGAVDSIALDSWGTDMVAVDKSGELLTCGVSTRDPRFGGLKERFFERVPRREIYQRTGIQFLDWNSVYLLFDLAQRKPWLLDAIDKMLFAPDCFAYLLTGEMNCDSTIASTSQMLCPHTLRWDERIVCATGLPLDKLMTPSPGRALGAARRAFGGLRPVVYSGCSHDTAAAVAGIPAGGGNFAYIICGSWAMIGTELDAPVLSERAEAYGFSNELGVDGKIRFLKNVMGMWLIQESRRAWAREGLNHSFAELSEMGARARPFGFIVDVDDPRLRPSGDIPGVIKTLCHETGQGAPRTVGETVRCIGDSLALKLRVIKGQLERCCGKRLPLIHIVAGGSQDAALCQTIADATGCPVLAGPAEASAYGNCAVQLIKRGQAKDLVQAREIIRSSVAVKEYEPKQNPTLEDAFARHQAMLSGTVGS